MEGGREGLVEFKLSSRTYARTILADAMDLCPHAVVYGIVQLNAHARETVRL